MNPNNQIALGIDIGGTSTKIGIVDRNGTIRKRVSIPTAHNGLPQAFLRSLQNEIDQLLKQIGHHVLMGIGIGAPSANNKTGIVENAVNLNWEKKVNFRKFFQDNFDVPVFVNNDANVAAIGEKIYGDARDMLDFITITLGTGVGCGIYSGGELIHGPDNLAGEIGHMTVKRGGRLCSCGRRGCLETYVSTVGIRRTVYYLISDFNKMDSPLSKVLYQDLTSQLIFEEAMNNDDLARKAFIYTGKILGLYLADLVVMTNPRAIFLVGGLANAGQLLLEPAKVAMENHLLQNFRNTIDILPSSLPDSTGAILGASAQVWESIDNMIQEPISTNVMEPTSIQIDK